MLKFYFSYHTKFNTILNELIKNKSINKKCMFITETYDNLDEILYLDPNVNYYCDNDSDKDYYGDNEDEKLYGKFNDWEDYWDSIYN